MITVTNNMYEKMRTIAGRVECTNLNNFIFQKNVRAREVYCSLYVNFMKILLVK